MPPRVGSCDIRFSRLVPKRTRVPTFRPFALAFANTLDESTHFKRWDFGTIMSNLMLTEGGLANVSADWAFGLVLGRFQRLCGNADL